jgi:hypothetical protein
MRSINEIKSIGIEDVRIHKLSKFDSSFLSIMRRLYRFTKKTLPLTSTINTPPGMRIWFTRLIQEISPDIVMMNYIYWHGLLTSGVRQRLVTVIDTHDFVSLNKQMREALEKYLPLPPIRAAEVDERILKEDFYDSPQLIVYQEEFAIYDKYNYTIAISRKDADIITQNTRKTITLFVPMTATPSIKPNYYDGPAIFPTGPNLFNIQGYMYFVRKVLPRIQNKIPSFLLQVTGSICQHVLPENGILLSGFISNLETLYTSARFLVCPIIGSTGQQVKIVESMAYGVPVIALRNVADSSPIIDGVNGLIADNAEDFANLTIRLWNDITLCRSLGRAAKETIASEFTSSRALETLSLLFR